MTSSTMPSFPFQPQEEMLPALKELLPGKQWLCFDLNKVPFNPRTGKRAKVNDLDTWATFEAAQTAFKNDQSKYVGIGRVLRAEDGFTGIDLDHCLDDQGNLSAYAHYVVGLLRSYTEITPSRHGLRIWVRGTIPADIGADVKLDGDCRTEMKHHHGYFTVTGNHLPNTPITIEQRQAELDELYLITRERREATRHTQQHATAYGRTALTKEASLLATTSKGGRHTQLTRSAFRMGQLIGSGVLDRVEVERELYTACCQNGLVADDESDGHRTLRDCIAAGMQHPRQPPEMNLPRYYPRQEQEAGSTGNNGNHPGEQTATPGDPGHRFHRTDLGNGERFAAQYGDRVRWCEAWKSWLVFNGKYWEQDRRGQVDQLAKATVRSIYHEAAEEPDEEARKQIIKYATASESNRAIRALLDRAKSELPVTPDTFNTHLYFLNCRNGTLDLRTGELHPHRPEDMLTRCLKINYTPEAPCQKWEAFICRILANNTELIAFIQQALGMSLTGDTSEQCLFICHGPGSNGKTTLLETVRIILGSYGLAANIETFQIHKSERINNDVAELYGARFVTASENALGSRLNEAFMKKATGHEPLRARRLHENEFEFMPEFTLWFAVNHKPVVKDTSKGMWRRVHFIPFTITIEGDQVDKRFGEKLLEEAEGILAWLVQGCLLWYAAGSLIVPQIVQQATQAYCDEMDIVGRYLAARCEQDDPHAAVGATELYNDYKRWCEATGERYEPQKAFGDRLTERGHRRERRNAGNNKITVYLGLRLLPPVESPLDGHDRHDSSDGFPMQATTQKVHIMLSILSILDTTQVKQVTRRVPSCPGVPPCVRKEERMSRGRQMNC